MITDILQRVIKPALAKRQ